MAIGDKIKRYFDKGVEASKTAFDKGMEASKTAFNKASSAVQDFSDKSVVRIEKHQFETKKEEEADTDQKEADQLIDEDKIYRDK